MFYHASRTSAIQRQVARVDRVIVRRRTLHISRVTKFFSLLGDPEYLSGTLYRTFGSYKKVGPRSDNPTAGHAQETMTVKATRPLESGREELHAALRKYTVDPEGLWETNKTAVRFSVRLGLVCRGEGTLAEKNSNSQNQRRSKKRRR